jgi:NADH dehydrogenase/NADH:ubiquinone oxidoreductase subunit G
MGAAKAVYVAGSLQNAELLSGKDLVVVQELFETETTDQADVVFPAASFAEVDGTFTNNAGNVQRVRRAIEPVHQAKPDWMITRALASAMGVELGFEPSASAVFKAVADAVPAYEGLRYPALKDETNPVQAMYEIASRDISGQLETLRNAVESLETTEKDLEAPKVGYKLHRLTTMTSKTPQFHLLANGNPKPDNLLVSPLVQIGPSGRKKEIAVAVGIGDRE